MTKLDKDLMKCSAISTMERSMPDYDYSHLVKELRELILEDIKEDSSKFAQDDIEKVYKDSWFIERYLLRMKMDVPSAHKMLRNALEFRNSPVISIKEFPVEFYQIGAIFHYMPDRKGNIPVIMRIKLYQKIPIVAEFLKAFLFRVIEDADKKANGRGIVLLFDLQGAGLNNLDMDLLSFVVSTLINYFPKGLSYLLIHELPWVLRSFWLVAKQWLSEDHKELVKFSDSRSIYEYFMQENLPDFLGGTCDKDYRAIPDGTITISQVAKRWNLNEDELYKIKEKFAKHLPQPQEGQVTQ